MTKDRDTKSALETALENIRVEQAATDAVKACLTIISLFEHTRDLSTAFGQQQALEARRIKAAIKSALRPPNKEAAP